MPLEPDRPGSLPYLARQGFRRFRKPYWNEHAYLEADSVGTGYGPWLTLVDPPSEAGRVQLGLTQPRPKFFWSDPQLGALDTDWIGLPAKEASGGRSTPT